jgi:undecaprenyl-diphosphatase
MRLLKDLHAKAAAGVPVSLHAAFVPSMEGMIFSFLAGLVALKWLSNWLENGRWYLFGIYCLVASAVVFGLHLKGY